VAQHIAALIAAGWSQRGIARAAGVSSGVVSKAKFPGQGLDVQIAEAILGVR
jgi:hypothetical protein